MPRSTLPIKRELEVVERRWWRGGGAAEVVVGSLLSDKSEETSF